jgi:hypothetical protein
MTSLAETQVFLAMWKRWKMEEAGSLIGYLNADLQLQAS